MRHRRRFFWIQQAGKSTSKFEKATIEKFNELVKNVDEYLDEVSRYIVDKRISDDTYQTYSELQTTPASKKIPKRLKKYLYLNQYLAHLGLNLADLGLNLIKNLTPSLTIATINRDSHLLYS